MVRGSELDQGAAVEPVRVGREVLGAGGSSSALLDNRITDIKAIDDRKCECYQVFHILFALHSEIHGQQLWRRCRSVPPPDRIPNRRVKIPADGISRAVVGRDQHVRGFSRGGGAETLVQVTC